MFFMHLQTITYRNQTVREDPALENRIISFGHRRNEVETAWNTPVIRDFKIQDATALRRHRKYA